MKPKVGGWDWVNGKGRGNGDPAVETWAEGIEERLCARVVELENQRSHAIVENNKLRAELAESRHSMGEEWAKEYAEVSRLRQQVETAVRENNRLRAESRHQHELANSRAARIFELQGELANARDLERGARSLLPGFQQEVASLREQREKLRTALAECERGHCEAAHREFEEGVEAREVVNRTARALGLNLSEDKPDGVRNIWAPENMRRVIAAAYDATIRLAQIEEALDVGTCSTPSAASWRASREAE